MLQHYVLLGAKPHGEWAGLTEICPHVDAFDRDSGFSS